MSIKSGKWIRRMAASHGMIEPFEAGQAKNVNGQSIVSYGTSSYGYDARCASEFKLDTKPARCAKLCRDRGGKFQGQVGLPLPRI